ncbi:MAG: hypothetical protein JSV26_00985 [bacterium]|nr:MAG: hypothetical protein JSV26_00985 [bacterium]
MKKNFGTLLVESGLITEKVLSEALQRQIIFGGRLGTNLIEMGAVSEESILKILSSQHKVPYAMAEHFDNIPKETLNAIPKDLLEKYRIIPIKAEKHRITLAMEDPTRLDVIDEVSFRTDRVIKPVVASELRITHSLERLYDIRRAARYIQSRSLAPPSEPAPPVEELVELSEEHLIPAGAQELPEVAPEILDPLDVSDINESFWSVGSRDDVAHTVITAGLRVMDDVFMLMLKGNSALGWMAGGNIAPPVEFGIWTMDITSETVLESIRQSRSIERLDGKKAFESDPWLSDLSWDVPQEVVICPLVLRKHTVSAIIGFSWQRRLEDDEIEFLVRVMRKASVAFEILILKSRILML